MPEAALAPREGGIVAGAGAGSRGDAGPVVNPRRSLLLKRAFDLVAALAGLAVLWPFFVLIALAIRLDDGGPVFFRQERIGLHGRPFRIWKFRTMRSDGAAGPLVTAAGDARITRVGRFLRRTKLDELCQLFNVVGGTMSLVGPRPEVARYVDLYDPGQRRVLELMPGVTDMASLAFIDEEEILARHADREAAYVDLVMPRKIAINLAYARKADLRRDIGVILATLLRRRPGEGAGLS